MGDMMMPKIVYGTAWKKERTAELVFTALKAGFRGVDTACQPKHYREDLVGEGIKRAINQGVVSRDELFIQTKFTSLDGQDRNQPLPYDPDANIGAQVTQSVTRSLANLGVDRIDSVILHSPLKTHSDTLAAYRALEEFVDAGKIGVLGVSNIYDPDLLEWLISHARVPPRVVQNRWYAGNGWDWPVYNICQENGITYQSFWTLTGSPALLVHPAVVRLMHKYRLSSEQVVYRLCQLWNITPLCGSTNEIHMTEALALKDTFGAEDADVAKLWDLMHGAK